METNRRLRATALEDTIKAQGRHQRWLARQIGISESHLSRVVAGERTLPEEQANRIAELLMVPLFLVFTLSDESKTPSMVA